MESLEALIAALPDDLRERAFTHVSWADDRLQSYERLEFLGDGVLGAAVAEELYRRYGDVDEAQVTPEAAFQEDLDADSLDLVELIMELEDQFGVKIPDEEAQKIKTVGQAADYIMEHQGS